MLCQFLLYNKVTQLCIYRYRHIPSLLHLPPSHPPYPTPLGGHKAPSWSPCAMRLLPTGYRFFVWQCVYVHATLSLRPSLPFPLPVSSSPFSMSASLFLSCPCVLQNHFFVFLFWIPNIFVASFWLVGDQMLLLVQYLARHPCFVPLSKGCNEDQTMYCKRGTQNRTWQVVGVW